MSRLNDDELSAMSTLNQCLCVLHALFTEAILSGSGDPEAVERSAIESVMTCAHELQKVSAQQLFHLCSRLFAIQTQAASRPDSAREVRTRGLAELQQQLKTFAASNSASPIKLPASANLPQMAPWLPQAPPVTHVSIQQRVGMESAPDSLDQSSFYNDLKQLFSHYAMRAGVPASPPQIRMIIAGGDDLVQAVAGAFCRLSLVEPQLCSSVDPRFMIVPLHRNSLASWLARHDGWYNRHIFVPWRSSPLVVPWLRLTEDDPSASASPSTSSLSSSSVGNSSISNGALRPGQWMRSTIESYSSESDYRIPLCMYKLEGWRSESKTPVCAVPMVQRFEVGAMPAAYKWRESRQINVDKLDDVLKDKTFEFTPPEMEIRFTRMDLAGQPSGDVTEEPGHYYSVAISSVPRRCLCVFDTSPGDPALTQLNFFFSLQPINPLPLIQLRAVSKCTRVCTRTLSANPIARSALHFHL